MKDWELQTAARTLWQEARGEPLDGQEAVAHVLWNRLATGHYGASIAAVCLARNQFSAWGPVDVLSVADVRDFRASCELDDDDPELVGLGKILMAAQTAIDITHGALSYYRKGTPAPAWSLKMIFCGQFGSQLFYR